MVADWLGANALNDTHGYQNFANGVDIQSTGSLWFDQSVRLHSDVSMCRTRFQQVVVQTEDKCWVIPRPFNPLSQSVIWTMSPSGIIEETYFEGNQYERMVNAFCCDIEDVVITDLSRSLRIAAWSEVIADRFERRVTE